MRKEKIRAHCPRCRHQQLFIRAHLNHSLHFVLTLVTAGLWSISWFALCIGQWMRPWRCEHCNWHNPVFTRKDPDAKASPVMRFQPGAAGPLIAAETSRLRP
jgi:hypothetical protein